MLDQAADEPLHRANEYTVQHDRAMRSVVGARVLQAKSLRQIEVELHRRPLPFPAHRIDQLEVELRAVKRAPALMVSQRLTTLVGNIRRPLPSRLPHLS